MENRGRGNFVQSRPVNKRMLAVLGKIAELYNGTIENNKPVLTIKLQTLSEKIGSPAISIYQYLQRAAEYELINTGTNSLPRHGSKIYFNESFLNMAEGSSIKEKIKKMKTIYS